MKNIMRKFLLVAGFIAVSGVCFAQHVVTQEADQTTDKNLENAQRPVIPSGRTLLAEMKVKNPGMYSYYQSGKKMQRTGIIMTGAGGGCVVIGALFSLISNTNGGYITMGPISVESDGNNNGLRKAGAILMVAGTVSLSVGIPVMTVGGKKKKQTLQDFKYEYYSSQQPSTYFQMNLYPNKLGIAYVF
jgi:hypothetical protein